MIKLKKLTEDSVLDKQYRSKAVAIVDKTLSFLAKHDKLFMQRNQDFGDPWYDSSFMRVQGGGFLFKYDQVFDGEHSLISFIFSPRDGSTTAGGIGIFGGFRVIYLPLLNGPWDLSDLYKRFASSRSTIVHELIHHFDLVRGGDVSGVDPKDLDGYYNDPLEMNAYYQEGMLNFELYMTNPTTFIKVFPHISSGFEGFYKDLVTRNIFNKEFMAHLSSNNKRVLQKRLYGYYSTILKDKGYTDGK